MALPIKPKNTNLARSAEAAQMPDLNLALPDLTKAAPEIKQEQAPPTPRAEAARKPAPEPAPEPVHEQDSDPNWAIDPVTGKRYKKLAGYPKEILKQSKKIINSKAGGLTREQLDKVVQLDEDFNLDDLNGSADIFLAHLRVPLDKDEQRRLREERAAKERGFKEAAHKAKLREDSEYED